MSSTLHYEVQSAVGFLIFVVGNNIERFRQKNLVLQNNKPDPRQYYLNVKSNVVRKHTDEPNGERSATAKMNFNQRDATLILLFA
jgi:hypothetical protein